LVTPTLALALALALALTRFSHHARHRRRFRVPRRRPEHGVRERLRVLRPGSGSRILNRPFGRSFAELRLERLPRFLAELRVLAKRRQIAQRLQAERLEE